ncbi:uncharacterized protein LOC135475638 [Liolophura sinensis]|uniref:uncharacterized protein LOC135475638 n=1 Tax=Liolophura sinensis TaxID=3198878 RepID=UPI003158BD15
MFPGRCLLQVITIFYIIILPEVAMRAVRCPASQIGHKLDMGQTRCCKPWIYTCPPGYPYTICDEEGGWDRCEKCRNNLIQPNPSNSSNTRLVCFMQKDGGCRSEDMVPLSVSPEGRSECVCDRSKDYVSHFVACDLSAKPCGIGKERQLNESCSTCANGTFKDWEGPGLCIPITNCAVRGQKVVSVSTPEKDNVCGETDQTTAPRSTVTTEPQTSPLPEPGPVTKPTKKNLYTVNLKWLYSLFLGLVVAVVIMVIVCIKKRWITCNICQLSQLKCTDICTRCFRWQSDQSNQSREDIEMQPFTSSRPDLNPEPVYDEILLPWQQPQGEGHQSLETPGNRSVSQDQHSTESMPEGQQSSHRSAEGGLEARNHPESQRSQEDHSTQNFENRMPWSSEAEGTLGNARDEIDPAQMTMQQNQPSRPVAAVKPMTAAPDGPIPVLRPLVDNEEYSRMGEDSHPADHHMLYQRPSPGMEDSLDDQLLPSDIHNLPPMPFEDLAPDMLAAVRHDPNTNTS